MKPLYLTEPVRSMPGNWLHPGGETLTRRMLDIAAVARDAVILDAGCGEGGSLEYLLSHGFPRVLGIDQQSVLLPPKKAAFPLVLGDVSRLPLADQCLDTILCQCVWNLTERQKTLDEFHRTLRPGGELLLCDIYLRHRKPDGLQWPVTSCFNNAATFDTVTGFIEKSGFVVCYQEDVSSHLQQTAAEFVFKYGSLYGFWFAVTGDHHHAKQACSLGAASRPGLFFLIAKKGGSNECVRS
ncbi:MAG: hypothetical protein CSA26_05985 [Desulfobacterales bacterium]|nr:MAG: hypothetical protein CSA26_05985 [Desulfobacterales bacterium]